MNIREFLEMQVNKNSSKVNLYFQDQEVTYETLNERINRVANGFLELGIRKGDKVCALLSNCPEFFFMFGLG